MRRNTAMLVALISLNGCAAQPPTPSNGADTAPEPAPVADPSALIRRIDERRRDDPYTLSLGGHPLVLTGEYAGTLFKRQDFSLAPGVRDDLVRLDQELQLEALYTPGSKTRLFFEIKALAETELSRENGNKSAEESLSRGQMWWYTAEALGRGSAMQIGRQNFRERRSWWWDDDLDAVRLHFNHGKVDAQLSLAREMAPESTLDGIDPAEEDLRRVIGHLRWQFRKRHSLEAYFLDQRDHSDPSTVGSQIARSRRDTSDAKLRWYGLRSSGSARYGALGRMQYWLDLATVRGDETTVDYRTVNSLTSEVRGLRTVSVSGRAFDVGVGVQLDLPARPAFSLGVARASGDGDPGDAVDGAFRQTGLEENKARLFGVKRFRYYGELTRPSLANLTVMTGAVGIRAAGDRNSSIDLVYHRYRQTVPAQSMREFRISAPLNGVDRDLGQELDVIIAIRESRRWELVVIAAAFKAGAAYGALKGQQANYAEIGAAYNF